MCVSVADCVHSQSKLCWHVFTTIRYDEIVTKLGPFLRGCGYNPKKDLEFLPISGLHGTNIKDPVPKEVRIWHVWLFCLNLFLNVVQSQVYVTVRTARHTQQCDWWTGATLFHVLDNVEPPQRDPMDSFRMPIIDRYRDMGTIIMGKSEAGVVKKGDTLLIMPNRCVHHGCVGCQTHASTM